MNLSAGTNFDQLQFRKQVHDIILAAVMQCPHILQVSPLEKGGKWQQVILDQSEALAANVEKVISENPKSANSLQWVRLQYQTSHVIFEKYNIVKNMFE